MKVNCSPVDTFAHQSTVCALQVTGYTVHFIFICDIPLRGFCCIIIRNKFRKVTKNRNSEHDHDVIIRNIFRKVTKNRNSEHDHDV